MRERSPSRQTPSVDHSRSQPERRVEIDGASYFKGTFCSARVELRSNPARSIPGRWDVDEGADGARPAGSGGRSGSWRGTWRGTPGIGLALSESAPRPNMVL